MNLATYSITSSNKQLLDEIVNPVLNRLTGDGEVKHVAITKAANGDTLAELTAVGEPLSMLLWCRGNEESVSETRERVYSDLQDALAESSFAWRELRQ